MFDHFPVTERTLPAEQLKPSHYNYFLRHRDGWAYGYNLLYRSLIKVPSSVFPRLKEAIRLGELGELSSQWVDALFQSRFLVERDVDELSLIKLMYYKNLFSSDLLRLVLLPTMDCNFNCPYCYEYKKPVFMTPEVQDAVARWVETCFPSKRRMQVLWFGGEPLMARDVVYGLTRRFRAYCDRIGADYWASVTTNGYLMDDAFLGDLDTLGVGLIQVTLDGDKPDHDLLRATRNGQGSFDRLMENMRVFCARVPEESCQLHIRVNCCDQNFDGIPKLLERVSSEVRRRANIFFRWVFSSGASQDHAFSNERGGDRSFDEMRRFTELARAHGWKTFEPAMQNYFVSCEADHMDQYTVNPDGSVAVCNHYQDDSEKLGNLLEPLEVFQERAQAKYARWITAAPFDDRRCSDCRLLPLCMGGCRKARNDGVPHDNGRCSNIKSSTRYYVEQKLASVGA